MRGGWQADEKPAKDPEKGQSVKGGQNPESAQDGGSVSKSTCYYILHAVT